MVNDLTQKIGDNSAGIQVHGDYIVQSNYEDIKLIFLDLFQLNFPKIQIIAQEEANKRIQILLEEIRISFERHKNTIDKNKFIEPYIQCEIQNIAISVAKRGVKSNISLLAELLSNILDKDCPELIELIAGETIKIIPQLNIKHLAFLSLMIIAFEATIDDCKLKNVNDALERSLRILEEADKISAGDIQYIEVLGCVRNQSIIFSDFVPTMIKNNEEYKNTKPEQIKLICKDANLNHIIHLFDTMRICHIGRYTLTATGRLLGWLNISNISKIDIKGLFN